MSAGRQQQHSADDVSVGLAFRMLSLEVAALVLIAHSEFQC